MACEGEKVEICEKKMAFKDETFVCAF